MVSALPPFGRDDEHAAAHHLACRLDRADNLCQHGCPKRPLRQARLHVLAIGINDYGPKATSLRLQFAELDAYDFAEAK
jgi:hypothetical protein